MNKEIETVEYPNLELIEYKLKEEAYERFMPYLANAYFIKYKAEVFMQTWVNTATGFDFDGCVSGQAFTDEYTTVMEMSWAEKRKDSKGWEDSKFKIYGVFFGNKMAYVFVNPNKLFFDDWKNKQMKSCRQSLQYLGYE